MADDQESGSTIDDLTPEVGAATDVAPLGRAEAKPPHELTAADFFTTRNLWALAAVWEYVQSQPDGVHDALSFVFTSVVHRASRRYQWNPKRPTASATFSLNQ